MEAKQVPLIEQLASVPADARLVIDDADGMGTRYIPVGRLCHEAAAAIDALRSRLAQQCKACFGMGFVDGQGDKCLTCNGTGEQPEQEPVAWLYEAGNDRALHWYKPPLYGTPLYTAQPQRPWVDLTDEQERKEFEQWYAENAFNFVANPIGSRECGLQWSAWKARAAHGIKEKA